MRIGFENTDTEENIMTTGNIQAICLSRKKGVVKKPVDSAQIQANHGIVGDAHAGDWHRQVSILPQESIDIMREQIPNLADGAFAENIVTSGVDFSRVRIGTQFQLGDSALLEVTQVGKECHTACAIKSMTGDCIMPREGIFCRVLQGGTLRPGDRAQVLHVAETV